ncbi:MAG TPA: TonB-dependent receptor [Bryobacteraceae bacterium]|nr:TonB-dependent receptor [Bryobacteraceae bacterium]
MWNHYWRLATVALLACRGLAASDGNGSISGIVLDAGGKPAPLASIMLVHEVSGLRHDLVADQAGAYQASNLPAGAYAVVARSVRTGAVARAEIVVSEGRNVEFPITLTSKPAVLSSAVFREIPLNGRNYLDVIRDTSEVTSEAGNASNVNSVGLRRQGNNYLVDGMDNNEAWRGGAILRPSLEAIEAAELVSVYIPADLGHATGAAIEVRTRAGSNSIHGSAFDYLQNSALDARNFFDGSAKPGLVQNQFGVNLGGPVRKSGWFFFVDDESMRERRGLTVVSTVPTAAERGGNFGAIPIYDPNTIYQLTGTAFARDPFAGNQIPLPRISDAARNLAALYPNPNLPGVVDNYRFTPSLVSNSDRLDFRSDKAFSRRSMLMARFNHERQNELSPGALPSPSALHLPAEWFAGSDPLQHADGDITKPAAWAGAISHTFVARPSLVNDVRAGIARLDVNASSSDSGLNAATMLGIPGLTAEGLPSVIPSGYAQLGAAGPVPFEIRTTSYQLQDTVRWTTARHAWTFGFQAVRRHVDGNASEWSSRGTYLFTPDYTGQQMGGYTGDAFASLLLGYPSEIRRDVQFEPYHLRGWELAGFAQDEFRIGRNLTVQAGIRYSLDPPVTEANNRLVNFNFDEQAPAINQFAGQGNVNQYAGLGFHQRDIAPRVSFALDLSGNGATVLRGAFTRTVDPGAYLAEGGLARNAPYAARLDIFNGTLQVGPNLTDGLPAPVATPLLDVNSLIASQDAVLALQHQAYTPYADQWGLFLQRLVRPRLTAEIGIMSSMGIHLTAGYNLNQPYPAPTPYCCHRWPFEPYDSHVDYVGFAGGSTYYAGQAKLSGEVASGLQIVALYRFAKSEDDASEPFSSQESRPAGYQYIYNPRGSRSPSTFDVTQKMVTTVLYELPFQDGRNGGSSGSRILRRALAHWRASAVVTAQTGFPFTPELAANNLNNGGFQLPNRVGSGALPPGQRSYLDWFNTSLSLSDPNHAFETPDLFQYGNSGFDILRGPGMATLDASLARSFSLNERLRIETRVEAFNLLNRTNFGLPDRLIGIVSSGVIDHTSTPPRQMQMVVRLEW